MTPRAPAPYRTDLETFLLNLISEVQHVGDAEPLALAARGADRLYSALEATVNEAGDGADMSDLHGAFQRALNP